jgi:hypothetical protein
MVGHHDRTNGDDDGGPETPGQSSNYRDRLADDRDETSGARDDRAEARDDRAETRDDRAEARDDSVGRFDS